MDRSWHSVAFSLLLPFACQAQVGYQAFHVPAPPVPPVGSAWKHPKAFMTSMFGMATPRLLAVSDDFDGEARRTGSVSWSGMANLFAFLKKRSGTLFHVPQMDGHTSKVFPPLCFLGIAT
ncbi:hypothetical protein [Dyella sp.]|uniref:hypothetical protein n=1 Tax=Dyella sp. TaxID=1869338 RepID=UPI002ED29D30